MAQRAPFQALSSTTSASTHLTSETNHNDPSDNHNFQTHSTSKVNHRHLNIVQKKIQTNAASFAPANVVDTNFTLNISETDSDAGLLTLAREGAANNINIATSSQYAVSPHVLTSVVAILPPSLQAPSLLVSSYSSSGSRYPPNVFMVIRRLTLLAAVVFVYFILMYAPPRRLHPTVAYVVQTATGYRPPSHAVPFYLYFAPSFSSTLHQRGEELVEDESTFSDFEGDTAVDKVLETVSPFALQKYYFALSHHRTRRSAKSAKDENEEEIAESVPFSPDMSVYGFEEEEEEEEGGGGGGRNDIVNHASVKQAIADMCGLSTVIADDAKRRQQHQNAGTYNVNSDRNKIMLKGGGGYHNNNDGLKIRKGKLLRHQNDRRGEDSQQTAPSSQGKGIWGEVQQWWKKAMAKEDGGGGNKSAFVGGSVENKKGKELISESRMREKATVSHYSSLVEEEGGRRSLVSFSIEHKEATSLVGALTYDLTPIKSQIVLVDEITAVTFSPQGKEENDGAQPFIIQREVIIRQQTPSSRPPREKSQERGKGKVGNEKSDRLSQSSKMEASFEAVYGRTFVKLADETIAAAVLSSVGTYDDRIDSQRHSSHDNQLNICGGIRQKTEEQEDTNQNSHWVKFIRRVCAGTGQNCGVSEASVDVSNAIHHHVPEGGTFLSTNGYSLFQKAALTFLHNTMDLETSERLQRHMRQQHAHTLPLSDDLLSTLLSTSQLLDSFPEEAPAARDHNEDSPESIEKEAFRSTSRQPFRFKNVTITRKYVRVVDPSTLIKPTRFAAKTHFISPFQTLIDYPLAMAVVAHAFPIITPPHQTLKEGENVDGKNKQRHPKSFITPNMISITHLVIGIMAGVCFYLSAWRWGGGGERRAAAFTKTDDIDDDPGSSGGGSREGDFEGEGKAMGIEATTQETNVSPTTVGGGNNITLCCRSVVNNAIVPTIIEMAPIFVADTTTPIAPPPAALTFSSTTTVSSRLAPPILINGVGAGYHANNNGGIASHPKSAHNSGPRAPSAAAASKAVLMLAEVTNSSPALALKRLFVQFADRVTLLLSARCLLLLGCCLYLTRNWLDTVDGVLARQIALQDKDFKESAFSSLIGGGGRGRFASQKEEALPAYYSTTTGSKAKTTRHSSSAQTLPQPLASNELRPSTATAGGGGVGRGGGLSSGHLMDMFCDGLGCTIANFGILFMLYRQDIQISHGLFTFLRKILSLFSSSDRRVAGCSDHKASATVRGHIDRTTLSRYVAFIGLLFPGMSALVWEVFMLRYNRLLDVSHHSLPATSLSSASARAIPPFDPLQTSDIYAIEGSLSIRLHWYIWALLGGDNTIIVFIFSLAIGCVWETIQLYAVVGYPLMFLSWIYSTVVWNTIALENSMVAASVATWQK